MLELAIVLAVTGIIAILSIPNLQAWVGKMRIRAAQEHLGRSVSVTRRLAVAKRQRFCLQVATDPGWDNTTSTSYLLGVTVLREDPSNAGVWLAWDDPDTNGWTNNSTTSMYRSVSLEGGSGTTVFGGTDGCLGLLFNETGFLDNPISEFAAECGGAYCATLTIRNKAMNPLERRTLWIDRGGNVRVTQGPGAPPVGPT
jgi:Tfp pilus assembly protein FimT